MKNLKQQTLVSLVSQYLSSYIIYSFTFQVTWFQKMLFSHLVVSNSLWPHGLQHTKLPVLHNLLEFSQTHVYWVNDAIQPTHIFLFPSPPALQFCSVQSLSHVWLFATPWAAAHQASHPSLSPGVSSNSCPLSWWCHPTISSSNFVFIEEETEVQGTQASSQN